MTGIIADFSSIFSNKTGKFKGQPIKIHVNADAVPVIQPPRRIPLQYVAKLKEEIEKMVKEDIIEGPISIEEPGTFLSNLVITDKKNTDRIRVTLDCQAVNKEIYITHEPIPTTEELRHKLKGSDRFTTLDMTNCFYQFEIEENARKLYAFRTPWGIFRYKRMVMGTSPASSEIQKKIRGIISSCSNAIHIKDDILVHGVGKDHDHHLRKVLETLKKHGITLRPDKCQLGKPEVKWFGNIYTKNGMSADPEKCAIIRQWPEPSSTTEVKSFLQTVQFNAKFLGGAPGQKSYPELTDPLRALTKKNARFVWGTREATAFNEIKNRLCSDRVLVPYDTELPIRLHVDSSPIGTQATLTQAHTINGETIWRPVNHTSRPWTPTEAAYGQIERESNGILTGMYMNKMYTLGTHVEVVNDHAPLIPIYNSSAKPRQLRVNNHKNKLLPFQYNLIYEPGKVTPCDYGSRHPPQQKFTEAEIEDWCVQQDTDIFVNRLIEENLPHALTSELLQKETGCDQDLQKLISCLKAHDEKTCKEELKEYIGIFDELTVINELVIRGEQIVIPTSLQADVVGLAHEGHQCIDKTLQLLRQTCWFPKMGKHVKEYVQSCHACNAASTYTTPVPLQPNLLPARPWQKLHADFKGPIGSQYYLHIIIDQFSKYPEVDIVTSTSFKKLRPVLDRVLATHGIPESITSDNGPPYPSDEMKKYAVEKGFLLTPTSPEDPQCNGFAENFVKLMCKLLHTAVTEGKDPKVELYNYLLHYRATPHSTTGMSPAEMLFKRKLQTKLPQIFVRNDTPELAQIREHHDQKKLLQKKYHDERRKAKNKDISVGDNVLIRQNKTTTKPPFDPKPYTVTNVQGNQISMQRPNGSSRIRDKNQVRKMKARPQELIPSWNRDRKSTIADYSTFDIEGDGWKEVHSTEMEQNNVIPPTNDINPQEDLEALYDLTTADAEHINTLLNAAINNLPQDTDISSGHMTRSKGVQLKWSPVMNSKGAVVLNNNTQS